MLWQMSQGFAFLKDAASWSCCMHLRYLEPFNGGLCALTAMPQPLQPPRGDTAPGHRGEPGWDPEPGCARLLSRLCFPVTMNFYWGRVSRVLQHLPASLTVNTGRWFLIYIQILGVFPLPHHRRPTIGVSTQSLGHWLKVPFVLKLHLCVLAEHTASQRSLGKVGCVWQQHQ